MAKPQETKKHSPNKRDGSFAQSMLFARKFFRHPKQVGWLLPSSRFLVDQVLSQIDWPRANVLVEYGPGVGTFTTRMLERMNPNAKLVVFEIDPDFADYLRQTVRDPRLHVIRGSATEVDSILPKLGCPCADYVISGIPFSTLPHSLREEIVRKTREVLAPDGSFLVYQVSDAVRPYLEQMFGSVSRAFELRNIIPARLFYCAP